MRMQRANWFTRCPASSVMHRYRSVANPVQKTTIDMHPKEVIGPTHFYRQISQSSMNSVRGTEPLMVHTAAAHSRI